MGLVTLVVAIFCVLGVQLWPYVVQQQKLNQTFLSFPTDERSGQHRLQKGLLRRCHWWVMDDREFAWSLFSIQDHFSTCLSTFCFWRCHWWVMDDRQFACSLFSIQDHFSECLSTFCFWRDSGSTIPREISLLQQLTDFAFSGNDMPITETSEIGRLTTQFAVQIVDWLFVSSLQRLVKTSQAISTSWHNWRISMSSCNVWIPQFDVRSHSLDSLHLWFLTLASWNPKFQVRSISWVSWRRCLPPTSQTAATKKPMKGI